MREIVIAAIAGVLFAAGLAIGGMTDPAKVQSFLDLFGRWDASLAFVMGGALGTHALLIRVLPAPPAAAASCEPVPTATRTLDARLLVGSALFGVGWGLAGYCPGPAFTSLATGGAGTVLFVLAMLGGILLHRLQTR